MNFYKLYVKRRNALKVKEIIKKHNFSLVKAICSKIGFPVRVCNTLFNSNIIPEWMYMEIINTSNRPNPASDLIFASMLMTRVRATLYEDPDSFPMIMNVFRRHPPLDVIVTSMEKEYYGRNTLLSISVILIVIFIVGMIIFLILWPSGVCETVTPNKFLVKLSAVSTETAVNNVSYCLSHHENGKKMLEYCRSLCNQTETCVEETDFNETSDYQMMWCNYIAQIFTEMNWTLTTADTNVTKSWCWTDMVPLFECLTQKTEL